MNDWGLNSIFAVCICEPQLIPIFIVIVQMRLFLLFTPDVISVL